MQYYSVGVGSLPSGGDAVWGGLQDNGVSLTTPTGSTYTCTYPGTTTPVTEQLNPSGEMSEPFGGDGGDEIVNPRNGCQTLGEYTDLTPSVTNNCGAGITIDPADSTGHWQRLGLSDATATGNPPTAAAVYLAPSPDSTRVYIATHGRGIWSTAMP